MAYKNVVDLSTDEVVSLGGVNADTGKANLTSIEGYYLGRREVNGENGVSYIQVFQTSKGNKGVWGKADINAKLARVKPGTMVLITFLKIEKLNKGKKMYKYDVKFDSENTIDVDADLSDEGSSSNEDDQDSSEEDQNSSDEDGSSQDEEDAVQAAALARAENKKRTEALLAKGKAAKN